MMTTRLVERMRGVSHSMSVSPVAVAIRDRMKQRSVKLATPEPLAQSFDAPEVDHNPPTSKRGVTGTYCYRLKRRNRKKRFSGKR